MKQLVIARHAKSSWDDLFCSDFDRGLNMRGKNDLMTMAQILEKQIKKPNLLIASPAKRTKKTALAYAKARGYHKKNIARNESVYEASLNQLLRIIEATDETVTRLMLVGHNPGLTALVNYCGYELANLPTCGVVVFQYAGKFRGNFEQKKCVLVTKYFPKEIREI